MRHVTDDQRRARLAVRHALAPGFRAASPEAATHAVAVLHATEAATVYLSCWARVDGLSVSDVERALYDDRSLVKQLAMRRTLFVVPRDLLPAVWGSASARVGAAERTRTQKELVAAGVTDDGAEWVHRAEAHVQQALATAPDGLSAAAVREGVTALDVGMPTSPVEAWSASRILSLLGLSGRAVRGTNAGRWATARPHWTLMSDWLGEVPPPAKSADGYREVVRRWLYSFGPGAEDDLVWWLGSTKAAARAALAELEAVSVSLGDGRVGWLLPTDLDDVADPGPWVALLPVLDPTTMGWRGRDFYLGAHRDQLFDTRGNAGTTAWVDGRAVGCWVQDDAGTVQVRLVEDVRDGARAALDAEAARLTDWLGGTRIGTVYRSPAMS